MLRIEENIFIFIYDVNNIYEQMKLFIQYRWFYYIQSEESFDFPLFATIICFVQNFRENSLFVIYYRYTIIDFSFLMSYFIKIINFVGILNIVKIVRNIVKLLIFN